MLPLTLNGSDALGHSGKVLRLDQTREYHELATLRDLRAARNAAQAQLTGRLGIHHTALWRPEGRAEETMGSEKLESVVAGLRAFRRTSASRLVKGFPGWRPAEGVGSTLGQYP